MSAATAIQWTDVTDNILVVEDGGWWCRMISEGCANCYAAKLNQSSFFGGNKLPYSGQPPKLKLREDIIDGWKKQTKAKRHFVASMTDVFGEWVPPSWAMLFLRGMAAASNQTFQVLTKRPDVMRDYVKTWLKHDGFSEVPSNIWLGVSVESQKWADKRIPILLSIPAKVRFLSVEPMLGRIDFAKVEAWRTADTGMLPDGAKPQFAVDWVIFGGESGPNARPCNIEWIRDGVRQCKAAGVAAFVKQLGSNPAPLRVEAGSVKERLWLKDKKGGDPSEWPADLRVREFPTV